MRAMRSSQLMCIWSTADLLWQRQNQRMMQLWNSSLNLRINRNNNFLCLHVRLCCANDFYANWIDSLFLNKEEFVQSQKQIRWSQKGWKSYLCWIFEMWLLSDPENQIIDIETVFHRDVLMQIDPFFRRAIGK